ncbi:MAG: two-component regulator propeller domain-containing protein [Bacteroidota bacterium]
MKGNAIKWITSRSGLTNDFVHTIGEDADGRLWIGTDSGLNMITPGSDKVVQYFNDESNDSSIANNVVDDVIYDKDGTSGLRPPAVFVVMRNLRTHSKFIAKKTVCLIT